MYGTQHRGLPPNRLSELLDQVRQEFDGQSRSSEHYENQVTSQIQEMEMIRFKVNQLEQAQIKMKNEYDSEVKALRQELDNARAGGMPSHLGNQAQYGSASQPQPPALGHGPSNLFSGIMANSGQGGPGLAPPPSQDQQPPPQQHPLQPPIPGPPPAGPPPAPQQGPFQGYQTGPPTVNGYGPQPPQPSNSPGMNKNRPSNRGPPGPATPQQGQLSYPDPRASPQIGRSMTGAGPNPHPPPPPFRGGYGNQLADIDPETAPEHLKRQGTEWFAVFNPDVPRVLDVGLVHNLVHESVVCCVRFSIDGRYVATGCNRSAQIFDVATGQQVSVLQDDSVDKDGDLYIRSVCFSPDGKLLATGAEDKLIRVWDIQSKKIRNIFAGHDQDIYSLDFARNGRHIASGSGDKTVRLWDIDVGQQILTLSIEDGVTTVAISPDGRYVAAGSLDRSVRVWDSTSGYLVERLEGVEGHKDSVYSVAFSPDGHQLVSGSLDKTIKMWELTPQKGMLPGSGQKGGKCIRTFEGHKDYVLSVCLTPHGEWVMSGSKDRGVQFWDPNTGVAQMMLQGHKNSVISVAPCPTGGLFATGSGDMRARIWSYGPFPERR